MKKPKIVMIARHCCIRVQKIALPLLDDGYDVHCIAHRIPAYGDHYRSVMIYQNLEQLYEAINIHKDADIFHVHNEPSWFVTAVKTVTDKPVILDAHDSMLLRILPEDEEHVRISVDERNNFQLADAHVFVSSSMAEICREEFGLNGQPYVILPSYVPKRFYRVDAWKWLGGICYEGRIDLPHEIGAEEMEFFEYCDYTDLAKELKQAGIPFHLYTPRKDEDIQGHYKDTAIWRGSYEFDKLIRKLGRHDWGLLGNLKEFPVWQHAMPNKLFEYLAAGIPIIALNAKLAGEWVEEQGFGIDVSNVSSIKDLWTEHRRCRKNIVKHRMAWCMERHIWRIQELYERLS